MVTGPEYPGRLSREELIELTYEQQQRIEALETNNCWLLQQLRHVNTACCGEALPDNERVAECVLNVCTLRRCYNLLEKLAHR